MRRDVVGDEDRVDLGDAGHGLALGEPVVFGRRMLPVVVGPAGPVCDGVVAEASLLDKGQLLLVAEDALRAEDHEQHERDADEDEARACPPGSVDDRQDAGLRERRAAGCRGTPGRPRRSPSRATGPKTVAAPPSSRIVQMKNVSDVV